MDAARFRFAVVLCLLAIVLGCSKDSNDEPSIDYGKPLGESLNPFTLEGAEMEASTVSAGAQAKMLDCDVPTTETRMSGEVFSTNYKVIGRNRESVDSHFMIRDEDKAYSTNTGGALYKRTYTLGRLTIDGSSALSNGPLSYRDTCTASGCNVKQREYLSGSPAYLVEVDAKTRNILRDMDMKAKKICSFKSSGAQPKEMIRQGRYPLGGVNYKALKYSSTEEGELYCEGGSFADTNTSSSVYMGKASRLRATIVLADTLPQLHTEMTKFSVPALIGYCSRTMVMQSEYIESDSRIYKGSAKEIVQASISGQIQTVEEFKRTKQNHLELLQRLRDNLTQAKYQKNSAETQRSEAEVKAKEARAKALAAEADAILADTVANKPTASPTEKDTALLRRAEAKAAKENAARLEDSLESNRQYTIQAGKSFQEAETALAIAEADGKRL